MITIGKRKESNTCVNVYANFATQVRPLSSAIEILCINGNTLGQFEHVENDDTFFYVGYCNKINGISAFLIMFFQIFMQHIYRCSVSPLFYVIMITAAVLFLIATCKNYTGEG